MSNARSEYKFWHQYTRIRRLRERSISQFDFRGFAIAELFMAGVPINRDSIERAMLFGPSIVIHCWHQTTNDRIRKFGELLNQMQLQSQ